MGSNEGLEKLEYQAPGIDDFKVPPKNTMVTLLTELHPASATYSCQRAWYIIILNTRMTSRADGM